MSFQLDNMMRAGKHTLVDCGYINEQAARDRVDALQAAGIGKSNVELFGYSGRVFVCIPPGKVPAILAQFPAIQPGNTYAGCTHFWQEPTP